MVDGPAEAFLPVAAPVLIGNEKKYVLDCLDSTWISSAGNYGERFESAFADFCGVGHAIACCNGTAALHLALTALGLGQGDEVIVPSLTFVATANAVTYCGARPVFVDVDADTWTMDAAAIEEKITTRTRGIVVVHLYGHPADMDPILAVAARHGLFVVEDAAQAHGALYKGRRVGSLATIGTFSFYGNKIVTCGEGGMVVTNDRVLADRVRDLGGQWIHTDRHFQHATIGYNYRMTNIAAAIGLAQVEQVEWHMKRHLEVAAAYRDRLAGVSAVVPQAEREWARHAYWMFTVVLGTAVAKGRDDVIDALRRRRIEAKPAFQPLHLTPPYRGAGPSSPLPVSERIGARGISLPTWAGLTAADVRRVSTSLLECLAS